jgi:hypothetical protein
MGQDGAGSISHLFLIIEAANTSEKDNDIPISIFAISNTISESDHT